MNELTKAINETREKIERKKRLDWNEQQMKSSMNAIAASLRDIYTHGLWRESHLVESFDEYCQKVWGITRQRAHQILHAENTRRMLSDGTEPEVAQAAKKLNDGQATELKGLPKEQAIEVLREAISKPGKMTAAKIKKAKARVVEPDGPDLSETPPEVLPPAATSDTPYAKVETPFGQITLIPGIDPEKFKAEMSMWEKYAAMPTTCHHCGGKL